VALPFPQSASVAIAAVSQSESGSTPAAPVALPSPYSISAATPQAPVAPSSSPYPMAKSAAATPGFPPSPQPGLFPQIVPALSKTPSTFAPLAAVLSISSN
jgi:hypothetical protein